MSRNYYNNGNVYDIVADKGAVLNRSVALKSARRQPVDITGYTGRMHIRETISSTEIIEAQTTENNRLKVNGPEGEILITIPAIEMETVDAGDYVYDLEIESPEGEVTRVIHGTFEVRPEVTR